MEKKRKIATLNMILVENGVVEKILIPYSKAIREQIRTGNVEAVVDDTTILLHSGDDNPILEGGDFYPDDWDVVVSFHLQFEGDYELFTLFYTEEKLKENIPNLIQLKEKIFSFLREKLSKKIDVYLKIR